MLGHILFGALLGSFIDYDLSFMGNTLSNPSSFGFSTAGNESHQINTFDTPTECRNTCTNSSLCLGFVEYLEDQEMVCSTLNNLGVPIQVNETMYSYTKITRVDNRSLHTITGTVSHSYPEDDVHIHKLFIDLNRNGLYDDGEPINSTVNNQFYFTNISEGSYFIREFETDNCIQLIPGLWGYKVVDYWNIDDYADIIVQYYYAGHPTYTTFNGGIILNATIDDFSTVTGAPDSYILGDSLDTYLSFKPNHGIIVTFTKKVIHDGPGNDISIGTFLNSTTNALVSVSNNNINFTVIGILNNTHHSFDLAHVNYSGYVSYIKLHFFNENPEDQSYRNIVYIKSESTIEYYAPPYTIYTVVPQLYSLYLVKDCHYKYNTYIYCILTRINYDEIDSCMVGIDLYVQTGTCDCENYDMKNMPFYGTNFSLTDCKDGCLYEINYNVFPDYAVKLGAQGLESYITNSVNCDQYDTTDISANGCITDLIDSCSRQPDCDAVSLDNHTYGYLYNDYQYQDDEDSYFLVKRKYLNGTPIEFLRYTTQTSTVTSTQTSTVTSTQTSTVTSTQTSTVTSTQTSTVTSTQTSTATSTQTSTATSTQTSTATSTQTSTATSTQTSTATSTQTSTATSTQTSTVTSTQTSTATSTQTSTVTSTQTSTVTSTQTSTVTSTQTSPFILSETNSSNILRNGLIIGLSLLLLIIVVGFILYNRRKNRYIVKESLPQEHNSYSNPVYGANLETNITSMAQIPELYADYPEDVFVNDEYMDVRPNEDTNL